MDDTTPSPEQRAFQRLYDTIARLRAPGGCPWDIEQTPLTLRETLIEEAYETVQSLTDGDALHICEELGDVFLNVTMLSYMFEQEGVFTVADSLNEVSDKLIRRHPHVFGKTAGFAGPGNAARTDTAEKVLGQWDSIKETVEGRVGDSVLDSVPDSFPPLLKAYKYQKKAAKAGFDWPDLSAVWPKVQEELNELKEAITAGNQDHVEDELGDLFFSLVNIARHLKVDPSVALTRTNTKFARRFRYVEQSMKTAGMPMKKEYLADMDRFWDEVKNTELG